MSDAVVFLEAGERMRELRGTVSQAEFAARIDVDRKTVVRWEAGERLPDGKSLLALMKVFGADVNYLLDGRRGSAGPVLDAAESVLLDSYRRCNEQAKQNLIQTAALFSAGLAGPSGSGPSDGHYKGHGAGMANHGSGAVQVGYAKGKVTVKKG